MPSCLAIWAFGRPSTAASRTASSLNSRVYSLRGLRSMEHPLAENYPPLDVSTERGHDQLDPKRPSKRCTLSGGVGATVAGRERRKRKWPAFDHDEILQHNRYQRSLYSSVDPGHFVAEVIWARCVRCVPTLVFGLSAAPTLVGVSLRNMRDAAGQPFGKDIMEVIATQGEGSVDYMWLNYTTNKVEKKHSFLKRVKDFVLGVGYYTR